MQVLYLKSWKCNWFPTPITLHWTPNNTQSENWFCFVSFDESLHCDLMVLVRGILRWIFDRHETSYMSCIVLWTVLKFQN